MSAKATATTADDIWAEVIRDLGEYAETLRTGGEAALDAKYKTRRSTWTYVARLRVRLEPPAFAALLGVGPRTLAAWEKGTRQPPPAVALLVRDMADNYKHWRKKLAARPAA